MKRSSSIVRVFSMIGRGGAGGGTTAGSLFRASTNSTAELRRTDGCSACTSWRALSSSWSRIITCWFSPTSLRAFLQTVLNALPETITDLEGELIVPHWAHDFMHLNRQWLRYRLLVTTVVGNKCTRFFPLISVTHVLNAPKS